jgi:hypothetical protein
MMVESIEAYLEQLKREMQGCDPALIQDALADSEEHLRTALDARRQETPDSPAAESLESVVERYGAPAEVADAYRETESQRDVFVSPFPNIREERRQPILGRFFTVVAEPRAWGAFLYAFLSILTGLLYCLWAVVGGSFAFPSLIFIIGIPIAAFYLFSVRGIALLEGRIVEALLGVRMPRKPFFVRRDLKWTEKLKALFSESLTWRAFLYCVLQFPLGLLYFGVIGGMFIFSLAFITAPVVELGFHVPLDLMGDNVFTPLWLLPLVCLAGLLLLPLTLHLAKWMGKWHGRYAKVMLVRR